MGIVKITAEEAKTLKGDSDLERLEKMSEDEIEKAAADDLDNPLLTDDELKELKPTTHKGGGVYGHNKNSSKQQK